MKDLYFEKDYGRLYEKVEGGVCEVFTFRNSFGTVRHLFIKREITVLSDQPYYDLVTPYGYGGPLIVECEAGKKRQLVADFEAAFQEYCDDNNIIFEFVRFHPLFENALDFQEYYDVKFKRKTIQTTLKDYEDPILKEYSSYTRRDIRQALRAGVEYRVILNPGSLEDFKKLYYSTMKRNDAASIYYFDDEYFSKCMELLGDKLIVVEVTYQEKVIGMSLNFLYGKVIHVHLSGTLQEYHHLASACVLQYALALWGKENGVDLIHHGGGRTGEVDDKLYLFKKKFGRNKECDYYTGTKIWNEEVYNRLNDARTQLSAAHQKI